MILPEMFVTRIGMFLVKHALFVESTFLCPFDPDRFLSFCCKTKPSCEIYLAMQKCVFFRFNIFFDRGVLLARKILDRKISRKDAG